ncbi:uncharacterized protein DNG_00378 [Cephalotrichum gorgonifer]|uniref:Haloacid dehalogenase-like hydrolase n=1 Tax=Cephalotrichum gorgonifer TaxID=2041049 RepID=A0AAE8SQQ2_9PEZI|nr:uncharacterized protein DNG_00378 [Cephalotrichum gorgonifer]
MAIVLDFDGTITVDDTINVLAQSALKIHKERGRDLSGAWTNIVDLYLSGHADYKANYPVPEGRRLSNDDEIDYLRGMRDTELASAKRLEDSGIFSGISPSEFVAAGTAAQIEGKVVLRDGLPELLSLAAARGWPVYILSVNWSESFIRGVLHQHPGDNLRIISNDIHDGGRIFSPDTQTYLATTEDKMKALRYIIREVKDVPTVYFGDSTTDFECLMLSPGIVISSSGDSSLLRTLSRIGLNVPHVNDGADADKLLWAKDIAEVLQSGVLPSRLPKGAQVRT